MVWLRVDDVHEGERAGDGVAVIAASEHQADDHQDHQNRHGTGRKSNATLATPCPGSRDTALTNFLANDWRRRITLDRQRGRFDDGRNEGCAALAAEPLTSGRGMAVRASRRWIEVAHERGG